MNREPLRRWDHGSWWVKSQQPPPTPHPHTLTQTRASRYLLAIGLDDRELHFHQRAGKTDEAGLEQPPPLPSAVTLLSQKGGLEASRPVRNLKITAVISEKCCLATPHSQPRSGGPEREETEADGKRLSSQGHAQTREPGWTGTSLQ